MQYYNPYAVFFTTVVIQYYNPYAVFFTTPPPPHQATRKIIFQKDNREGTQSERRRGFTKLCYVLPLKNVNALGCHF